MQRKQFTIARLTIALDALGATHLKRAAQIGMDPVVLHSGRGNLSVCGSTHSASYKVIFMVGILDAIIALVVVIELGSLVGSF